MPTIYLDVLLLQSLYVNYFLLRAAAKLTHTPLHWIRCGLAAAEQPVFPVDPAAALAGMVSAGV